MGRRRFGVEGLGESERRICKGYSSTVQYGSRGRGGIQYGTTLD